MKLLGCASQNAFYIHAFSHWRKLAVLSASTTLFGQFLRFFQNFRRKINAQLFRDLLDVSPVKLDFTVPFFVAR